MYIPPPLTVFLDLPSPIFRLGLEFYGAVDVGDDYAITLRLWRERLIAKSKQIEKLGYPRRFIRMYEFYFAYCEVRARNMHTR